MTKYVALSAITLLLSTTTVFAQTPVPLEEQVTQDLKQRVQKAIDAAKSAVAGTTTEASDFGLVGTVEKVLGSTLQFRTLTAKNRIVELDPQAVIIRANRRVAKEEIELNSPVIIMGSFDGERRYIGKRIIISDTPLEQPPRDSAWGTVSAITTRLISLTPSGDKAQTSQFPLTTQTKYFDILDQSIKRTDLTAGTEVFVITPQSQGSTPSASRVYTLTAPQTTPTTE